MNIFDTIRARLCSASIKCNPLEIGVFAFGFGRIVMAPEQHAFPANHRSLATDFAGAHGCKLIS